MSLESVQVYTDLNNYEQALSTLVEGVSQFRPELAAARQLVDADRALSRSLERFAQYDAVDTELQRLDREARALEARTASTLETLDECHRALSKLPMLEQVRVEQQRVLEQRQRVNSAVLLAYATRLSKFTRVPAGVAAGPNNYVWPAEDALRRGQLAVAALHSDEVTLGKAAPGPGNSAGEQPPAPQEEGRPASPAKTEHARHARAVVQETASESPVDVDLDLFDPDEF